MHACLSTLQVTFLGDFFRFTKADQRGQQVKWFFPVYKKCVRTEELSNRFSRNWIHVHSKKVQMSLAAQYSCSTRQNNARISSVQTDAIITHKQSAVFRTTEKSVDEQSWHQCRAASFDGTDNIFRPCSIERHAAAKPIQHPHILAAWCDFCCVTLLRCAAVCRVALCERTLILWNLFHDKYKLHTFSWRSSFSALLQYPSLSGDTPNVGTYC